MKITKKKTIFGDRYYIVFEEARVKRYGREQKITIEIGPGRIRFEPVGEPSDGYIYTPRIPLQ